jgi:ParB family chromosome partitioning protein
MPDLPIGQLAESKTNPRRHFDPGKLAELAASAKQHGILEPLLVRPHNGKGLGYEIVAGARRYRAAKLAELKVLPVRIMELTDEQVLEIQLIENLQREDPHPMEEADGYQRLIAMGHTAEELAEKVGKDRSYIYKRIQLAALIPAAKDAFLENRINIGHALLICRLP